MSLSYAAEKLAATIRDLATSPVAIQERLIEAVAYNFIHVDIERDVPKDLKEEFQYLHDRLTRDTPDNPDDGSIYASVQNMTTNEAREISQRILALAYQVDQYLDEERNR